MAFDPISYVLGQKNGGGGTSDYDSLSNKPQIGGVTLSGNKSASDLGLVPDTREINGKPLSADVTLDKSDMGLGNVDNTSDADKPISAAVQAALNAKVNASAVGAANGVAELDSSGKVLSSQLPSYVDDVLEYASSFSFPAEGESGKIYVAIDTNLTYRWTGSAYVEISPSLALGETSATAYRGDRGKAAYDHAQIVTGNPHGVTKSDVGLGNADNTSDLNKPISTATQTALNNKVDKDGAKVLSDNNYTTAEKNAVATIGDKVDKVTGKGLSTNDYTTAEKNDLAAIKALLQTAVFYRTASGNPVTFADGYPENLRKLSVTLTPSQSGSGDPYPPGGGKNLFDAEYSGGTVPASAVTISNGAITINYTGQANDTFDLALKTLSAPPGTRLVLSGVSSQSGQSALRAISSAWVTLAEVGSNVQSAEFTLPDDGKVRIRVYVAATTNTTIYPMIRLASDTDPTFAPYSNIRPISGASSVTVTRTGENGANSQSVTISLVDSNSDPLTVYGGTLDATAGTLSVAQIGVALTGLESGWTTALENTSHQCYCLPFPTLFVRGSGVCSHYITTLIGTNTTSVGYWPYPVSNTSYSNIAIRPDLTACPTLADFKTFLQAQYAANTPVQCVYELASPVTYQLTAAQLSTLSGYNAVSADAGTLALEYRADASITLGGGA